MSWPTGSGGGACGAISARQSAGVRHRADALGGEAQQIIGSMTGSAGLILFLLRG